MNKMITKEKMLWSFIKLSALIYKEMYIMYEDQSGEFVCKIYTFPDSLVSRDFFRLLLNWGGEKEALPELRQSFDVIVAHFLTSQSCFLWSNCSILAWASIYCTKPWLLGLGSKLWFMQSLSWVHQNRESERKALLEGWFLKSCTFSQS